MDAKPNWMPAKTPSVAQVDPLLVTSSQAAKALSMSPRTLWTLTNSGEIPCVRFGRAVRYDPDDLKAWIRAQKAPHTEHAPAGA